MLPAGGAQAKQRFLTEALITGNLAHPGIPAVYERGDRADGVSYYAMQLVSGRTLAAALETATSLKERLRLVPAVVKVAETVAYAHDRGVVHRDLKPENVLLGRHGEVFLLDWGIAKVRGLTASDGTGEPVSDGAKTQVGAIMGSPMYMAPEQARGDTDAIDERTDVFALGTMLYHVLAGRAPYQGNTVLELAAQAIEAKPPPVTSLAPDVSPALAALCEKAMQREPSERHQSALEVAAALGRFQSEAAHKSTSRVMDGVLTAGLGAVVLIATALLSLGIFGAYMLARVGGTMSFMSLFATVVSLSLAAIDYRSRGQGKLVAVGLALAMVTLCVGLSQVLLGMIHTSSALQAPGVSEDVPRFLHLAAESAGEMSYGPFSSVPLALAQVVVWALVWRRNALVER